MARRRGCAEFEQRMQRRSFLQAGALGVMGLSLPQLLKLEAQAATDARKSHSVIILWMRGGPSQHETWDPKPDAPIDSACTDAQHAAMAAEALQGQSGGEGSTIRFVDN